MNAGFGALRSLGIVETADERYDPECFAKPSFFLVASTKTFSWPTGKLMGVLLLPLLVLLPASFLLSTSLAGRFDSFIITFLRAVMSFTH